MTEETAAVTEAQPTGLLAQTSANTQPAQEQAAPTDGRPDWLADEKYWDPEGKQVKAQDLYKALQSESKQKSDLRRIISKGLPEAPESADGYVFEHETYKNMVDSNDPAVAALRNVFHKNGLPNTVFNETLGTVLDTLRENGMLQEPLSKEEAQARQAEMDAKWQKQEMAKLGDQGTKVIQEVAHWKQTLLNRGILNEAEAAAFDDVGYSAEGILLLNKLRGLTGEKPMPVEGIQVDGLPSVQEWQAMHDMQKMQDPAYRDKVMQIGMQLQKRGLI